MDFKFHNLQILLYALIITPTKGGHYDNTKLCNSHQKHASRTHACLPLVTVSIMTPMQPVLLVEFLEFLIVLFQRIID